MKAGKTPQWALGVLMVGMMAGAALGQGQQVPPIVIQARIARDSCSDPNDSWNYPGDACILEGQTLYLCLTVIDPDWETTGDPNSQQEQQREGVGVTVQSLWEPYIRNGVRYGPEPPPVPTDAAGVIAGDFYYFPPPVSGITLSFAVPFQAPDFNGVNQARLRGLIDYDVLWQVLVRAYNVQVQSGGEPSTLTGPSTGVTFTICAVENPALVPGSNSGPVADAGPDQTVALDAVTGQVTVRLDGRRSFDPWNIGFNPASPNVFYKDTLRYTWEWVSGPVRVEPEDDDDGDPATWQVTLEVPTTAENPYVFQLTVDDGVNALPSIDTVRVWVRTALPENLAPRAKISGPTTPVPVGGLITLDGSLSTDPDGDQLLYYWRQTNEIGGPLATDQIQTGFQPVSGVNSAVSTWRAITAGTYYFRLLVIDQPALRDPVLAGRELSSVAMTSVVVSTTATSGAQASSVREDQTAETAAPATDSGWCGRGLFPLAFVPVVLWFLRSRYR